MLKYLFYPLFGLSVVGAYGVSAATATDVSSVQTQRSSVPSQYRGSYAAAPIVWRTGFHGPAAYRASSSGSSGSRGGSYGGGYYGGFGGGK